ncbi:MAG: hypothetical protein J4N79_00770 [Chloroflexi bacterium]|nr:hypothetical protein [Chloroflexota bacterium]
MARSWKKFERTGVTLVAIVIWVPSEFRGALQQGTVIVILNLPVLCKTREDRRRAGDHIGLRI